MKCNNCGAELPETAKFCHMCGTSTEIRREEFTIDSDHLIEEIKKILHQGNVTKIIVKDEHDRLLMNIPVTVGVIGVLIAPWLAALGAIAAFVTRCTIIVEKKE